MRQYYKVASALAVALIAIGLTLSGFGQYANLLLTVYCLFMAAHLAWGMVQDIRGGTWGVDILAVSAILATLAVGEYWAAIVIVIMLTGGESLEDYANARATRELSALLARAPTLAHLRTKDGEVVDIAIGGIKVNDELLVKPGEVVPVDAKIVEGASSFDESSLTGESLPVDHKTGDEILSGSVNGEQALVIRALRSAADSQYQQIIDLVKAANEQPAPFVRLADRYAVPFTLVSFVIAGIAWAIDGHPLRFAQVLVVATPCPLLIGAPVALISGMSRSAKHGIIVKSGAILEKLAVIKTVAFDKTGTLTCGEPEVTDIVAAKGSQESLLTLAASAEQQSAHILAQAVVTAAKKQKLSLTHPKDVREMTGGGVTAIVDGKAVLVGKASYLKSQKIGVSEDELRSGQTAVYIAVDGTFAGTIYFADKVRENAKQTLAALRQLGINHTLMLTGDAQATAERIAKEVGITDVKAECLPTSKVAAVKAVTDRPVMMVGDGVNDAPVLAAADVGLAMGARGSTAASETADVVVLIDDISRSALAIKIAKDTLHIALQSIWIGIAISVGLMLVATTGIIPAVVGAGLQEVVDVVVIFNALRAHGSWQPVKR
jgi:heavy metal translocating P-type ATPase